jgi:heme exporter protein D
MGTADHTAMDCANRRPASSQHPPGALLVAAAMVATAMALLPGALLQPHPVLAQSNLLESVRRDPARAKRLCRELRQLNQQGISYTSKQALRQIASQENLSLMDAEVLTTYVVGLHCPDVR